MKRQQYSLAAMMGAIFIAFAPYSAVAESCVAPPEKLQLHFAFDWDLSERGNLVDVLNLQCGEPENIDRLRQRIDSYFRLSGLPVTQVTWRDDSQPGIVEFEIITPDDTARQRRNYV